jgi:CheY-like chemotaxis protein
MARMVDDLLDYSRIERGKVELRRERVDLGQVVTQAMETCKPLLEAKDLHLTVALPGRLPDLEADPIRLEQMLCNLVSNACKFTPQGGEVRVSAASEGPEVVLRVRDNGMGMTPETEAHSFDLFYQAGKGLDQPHSGLGIGLTLVRQLAELHGGSAVAHSEGPGMGSEFLIRLPAMGSGRTRIQPVSVTGEAPKDRIKQVLIIDDDDSVRTTLGMLLKEQNYQVTLAASGEKGIQLAKAVRPDIALIDLGMPGLSGLEVAARIRAELGKTVYLVALTGYSRGIDIAKALASGFDKHMVKTGDPRDLLKLLTQIP